MENRKRPRGGHASGAGSMNGRLWVSSWLPANLPQLSNVIRPTWVTHKNIELRSVKCDFVAAVYIVMGCNAPHVDTCRWTGHWGSPYCSGRRFRAFKSCLTHKGIRNTSSVRKSYVSHSFIQSSYWLLHLTFLNWTGFTITIIILVVRLHNLITFTDTGSRIRILPVVQPL